MPETAQDAFKSLKESGIFDKSRKGLIGFAIAQGILEKSEELLNEVPNTATEHMSVQQKVEVFAATANALAIIGAGHMIGIAIEDAAVKSRGGTVGK